ncbi:MAG TPA: hypothetical protein VF765_23240 [Polyangiaceae bacterium]
MANSLTRLLRTASLLLPLAISAPAAADDTIKHPGDHPDYSVELEPHGLVGWFGDAYGATAFGLGGRASIPIVQNGFIKSINNSVGITFGLDLLFYGSCYYHGSCSATSLELPVAMQWNFFVAQHWSVFGEPGLYIYHAFLPDCPAGLPCPTATGVLPAFWAGGRYHISDSVSLTMRIGYPTFSFGVSFFL